MTSLPLNALRALAMVHAHGGVRAAARELGVAHSSISRHLAELATWLGSPVLREGGARDGGLLTAQGEQLAIATLGGLGEIERAVASMRERRSSFTVTIATSPSFASRWLLPRLPRLEAAHPRIQLSLVVDQRLDDLDRGDIDLALRMGRGPWPGLVCEALMDDVAFPVTGRAYAEAHAGHSLAGMRLLHDRDPQVGWSQWREHLGPVDLDVGTGPRFASSDLVLRAAQQSQGVALARERLARDDLAAGTLLRPFGDPALPLGPSYWMVTSRRVAASHATKTVMAWLRDIAREA